MLIMWVVNEVDGSSGFPATRCNEVEATYQSQAPDDGRQWNGVRLLCGDLNRAKVDSFLCGRIGEARVSDGKDATNDEENGEENLRFHR
jgi:hypothetical protein